MKRFGKKKQSNPHNPFEPVSCSLSKQTHNILKMKSSEAGLPIPRLLAIAVDNELEKPKPFVLMHSPSLLPESDSHYPNEVSKIINYLKLNSPRGIGRDLLMLSRRDMGIPDRERYLLAYREALRRGEITEGRSVGDRSFTYGPSYTIVRLAHFSPDELIERKRQIYEKLQEIVHDPTILDELLSK